MPFRIVNSSPTGILAIAMREGIDIVGSDRLITAIADEMNFTSVSYFSRYCTNHIDISPAKQRLAGAGNHR